MDAALSAADETVAALLACSANPNKTNSAGSTALMLAIQSGCSSTIGLLAPETSTGLGAALEKLAREQVPVTPDIRQLVEKAAKDQEAGRKGLEAAVKYGHVDIVKLLIEKMVEQPLPESLTRRLLEEAVMSDSSSTCAAVLAVSKSVPEQVKELARKRGRKEVVRVFDHQGGSQETDLELKKKLKMDIMNKRASIKNSIYKSDEFRYNDEMLKLSPLLLSPGPVLFSSLLESLHILKVHAGPQEGNLGDWGDCPGDCSQKEQCIHIREVFHLLAKVVEEMGHINKVFQIGKGRSPSIVGSMKEGTRTFSIDEIDVHVSLKKQLKTFCTFDPKTQRLLVKEEVICDGEVKKCDEAFLKFVTGGVFDCQKFFEVFLETVAKAVENIDLSAGYDIGSKHYEFTMTPLTTCYEPCLTCMILVDEGRPQARRCRHNSDCQAHMEGQPECQEGCQGGCHNFSHTR